MSQFFSKPDKDGHSEFAARLHELGVDAETQCYMVLAFLVGSTVELSQCTLATLLGCERLQLTIEANSDGQRHRLLPR